jgi:hypothetical protein
MTEERSTADLDGDASGSASPSAVAGEGFSDSSESDMSPKPGFPDDPARGKKKGAALSPQTRDRIASQLRTMYDTVANQPVPDRFAELIARLDTADRDS